jgi:hypothetical protein
LPSPLAYISACTYDFYGAYWGDNAVVCTGGNAQIPTYSISGPQSFTVESSLFAWEFTSASGIATGLYGNYGEYSIASSYIAGQPIISRATAPGLTLASLGRTTSSGTLGTWTLADTGDTISVKVFNPVPGPLPVLGAGAAFAFSRRLRQRIQRSKAAASA